MQGTSFDAMFNQMLQNKQQQQTGYLDSAKQLANGILQYQQQQRAEPFVKALTGYGQQYAQAQDDTARQQANAAANAARAAFMQQGGSPYDLPQNLWGANPQAGLQTAVSGDNMYAPAYSGDNLTYAQRVATQEMQQKAMESALRQATYQNIDLPLAQAQIGQAEAQTANYWRNANEPYSYGGGGGSGSGGGYTDYYDYLKDENSNQKTLDTWAANQAKADNRLGRTALISKDTGGIVAWLDPQDGQYKDNAGRIVDVNNANAYAWEYTEDRLKKAYLNQSVIERATNPL